jgi:hypothetical protein
VYEVLPPYGVPTQKVEQPAKRLDTLEGKTICGIGGSFHFLDTWPVMVGFLAKKYPTAKFIGPDVLKSGACQAAGLSNVWNDCVGPLAKQYKCDAVITGNGC